MDKRAMEQVREFDKKLLQIREYEWWFYQIPMWVIEGAAFLFFVCVQGEWGIQKYAATIFYAWCVSMQLKPYITVYQKGERISVYELLSFFPVNEKDIFKVRLQYVKEKLWKRFVILLLWQVIMIFYHGEVQVENIINPILMIVVTASVCAGTVAPWVKK